MAHLKVLYDEMNKTKNELKVKELMFVNAVKDAVIGKRLKQKVHYSWFTINPPVDVMLACLYAVGMGSTDIAKEIGVSQAVVSEWRSGRKFPTDVHYDAVKSLFEKLF